MYTCIRCGGTGKVVALYKFEPQEDITLHELAKVMSMLLGRATGRMLEQYPEEVRRHFKEEEK